LLTVRFRLVPRSGLRRTAKGSPASNEAGEPRLQRKALKTQDVWVKDNRLRRKHFAPRSRER